MAKTLNPKTDAYEPFPTKRTRQSATWLNSRQVMFTRWCMDPKGRTPVSVDPTRVDCTEWYCDAFHAATGEDFPAATKIVMKGKQKYVVQGSLAEVVSQLNWS